MAANLRLEKQHHTHGGIVQYYKHEAHETKCSMGFSVFLPPNYEQQKSIPYVIFLSGLTCTEDNFTTKGNAYQKAAALGLAVLAPDTSPRGDDIPNHDDYDLGQGAGFYLDARQAPWATHFRMESYLLNDLLPLVEGKFNLDKNRKSIMGHSMGGHGALTLYLRHAELFKSVSAFAPIVASSQVPWGQKAFTAYLGADEDEWLKHDACALMEGIEDASNNAPILIDQGAGDDFLEEQLKPHLFKVACDKVGQALDLRLHPHYDHSYFFIQTFIDDHLDWHYKYL